MKVLITGARGQLGHELKHLLETGRADIGAIPAAYEGVLAEYVDFDMLDISSYAAVKAWFDTCGPYDIVFNCAAVTNVDGCEADEAHAYRVNAMGAENLALAANACGSKFVHVSTDYVFPGDAPEPRSEDDPVRPVSAYGRTKWAGEVLVRSACARSFVVRTAWLYGYVGKNFVKTMLRLAHEGGKISVVADQFGNPTNANDLAYEMLKIALTSDYGTYHCTNNGTCSWFDFASAIVDRTGMQCEKEPLSSWEYKRRFPKSADRPKYSSLRNKHLEETVGDEMRTWQEALASYLNILFDIGDTE